MLSSRFVWEILTHQEMAPSWISTNKNIHAKDKPAQLCASPQPAAFPSDVLRPLPNYRGTSGFPVSFIFRTLFLNKRKTKNKQKHTHTHFFIEFHSGRKTGLQFLDLNFQKTWSLFFFFSIKPPHNFKFLHVLIIQ